MRDLYFNCIFVIVLSLIHLRIYIIPVNDETATSDFTGFLIKMEIWKTIKDFEDYQISNLGNVKSFKYKEERILKKGINTTGYYFVILSNKKGLKNKTIHKLVAENFLNHTSCGYELVVNHINFNKLDNRLNNLEVVTQRENSNKKHIKSKSKYVGVYWNKKLNKWTSSIYLKPKNVHLGVFENEYDAHLSYQNKLKEITTIKTK